MEFRQVTIRACAFFSPLGWLILGESGKGLCFLRFFGPEAPSRSDVIDAAAKEYPTASVNPDARSELLEWAKERLLAYIEKGRPIPALPVDVPKGAPFERSVREAIARIPFGETRSYLELARDAGNPRAARAAGGACGKNPLPVFIPCHRVVRSTGALGGFAGGLDLKRALLEIEGRASRGSEKHGTEDGKWKDRNRKPDRRGARGKKTPTPVAAV